MSLYLVMKDVFFSAGNIKNLIGTTTDLFKKEYGVSAEVSTIQQTLGPIMNKVFQQFGRQEGVSPDKYIKDLNTITTSETIKAISEGFRKNSPSISNNMSMVPQFQQPAYNSQGPNMSDMLLQQRINERGGAPGMQQRPGMQGIPGMHGMQQPGMQGGGQMQGYPQQGIPMQPMQPMQPQAGSLNIHPAVLQQFQQMSPQVQQQYAMKDPVAYQQIVATLQRQYQQANPMIQQQNGQGQGRHGRHDSDSDTLSDSSLESRSKKRRRRKDKGKGKGIDEDSNASSDLLNSHSSEDSEAESTTGKHRKREARKIRTHHGNSSSAPTSAYKARGYTYLSLDFRSDLKSIDNNQYTLSFPTQHNVRYIELESCLVNCNAVLEREPCIYMVIKEIPGDYRVTMGNECMNVFGKLIQEKTINNFIVFKPENCCKKLKVPERLKNLTISFHKYDLTPIPLNKLLVRKWRPSNRTGQASAPYVKVITKTPHHMSLGDRVNICMTSVDSATVDAVDVLDVPSDDCLILEDPINKMRSESSLQLEKTDLKCNLTFKIHAPSA